MKALLAIACGTLVLATSAIAQTSNTTSAHANANAANAAQVGAQMTTCDNQAKAKRPPEDLVACATEPPGHIPKTHLFNRGDVRQPKQEILPGELSVLPGSQAIAPDDASLPTTGRRLAFARRLTDGKHPLLARTYVNRLWMHHFGRGIVASPGDFGQLGERPSHPELLDWLASDFMDGGWRLKPLHKLLMTSSAYRQSSRRDPRHEAFSRSQRHPVRKHQQGARRTAAYRRCD